MGVDIRTATIRDLGAIQELNNRLFEKEHDEYDKSLVVGWPFKEEGKSYFSGRITGEDGLALVAEVEGKIVGYLVGALGKPLSYKKWEKVAELENMFVLKEHRGLGIGAKLTEAFLKWCRDNGAENVKAVAAHQNLKGINFYKKMGFKETEITLEKQLRK